MQNFKSHAITQTLVWLAFFAFVAHTFDVGALHCACLHRHNADATGGSGLAKCDFVAPAAELRHFCRCDCELQFDSPELIEIVLTIFFLSVWGRVAGFSNVRRLGNSSRAFRVPLGRSVFLFFESLLI